MYHSKPKNETQLQHNLYTSFHNRYPELRGCIFLVRNETTSNKTGIGLVPGAADWCGCINGRFVAFELKFDGNRHDIELLQRQYDWGQKIQQQGGFHSFIYSGIQFFSMLEKLIKGEEIYYERVHPEKVVFAALQKAKKNKTKTVQLNFKI